MTSVDYESNNNKPDECRDETAEENDDQYQPIDDTPPPTPCVETGVKSPRINEEGKDEEEAVTAIKTTGPAPTQDEVGAGWSARRRRFVVFWLVLLGLGVVIAIVVVVIKFGIKPNDPVTTSSNTPNNPATTSTAATPDIDTDNFVTTSSTATSAIDDSINTDDFVTTSSTATPEIDDLEIPVVPSIWKQQGEAELDYDIWATEFMAFSADTSTIAVGYSQYPIQVFRADDDGEYTVQIGQEIYPYAADISADGKTIICGFICTTMMCTSNDSDGSVQVFSLEFDNVLSTVTWKQIGQDIIGTLSGGSFGRIVSISKDGKTIAASSGYVYNYSTELWDSGPVRIYRLAEDGTSWEQIGEDIIGGYSESDTSLSLSADGSTIVIGGELNDANGDNSGQVTVYRFNSGVGNWEQLGQSIYGNEMDEFGSYVQLSNDGNILLTGKPPTSDWIYQYVGYARVYSLTTNGNNNTDTWQQIGQDFIIEDDVDSYGWPVSLSDDGKTLAMGAPDAVGENVYESFKAGRATIYRMDDSNSGWMQLGDAIKGVEANENLGYSVFLSADGNKLVIGYRKEDEYGRSNSHLKTYVLES